MLSDVRGMLNGWAETFYAKHGVGDTFVPSFARTQW
jgi:hypothetical protein